MPAMLAHLPDLIVEFAPTNAPLDTAPTWVDISAYARVTPQISTRRGRTAEGVAFSYGTMQVTLDNRDRRFDPLHTAGPYFGNLRPRKQIRLRAVWSATSYTIFTGWVAGWPQDYGDGRTDATVTIDCIDALAWLAEAGLDYEPLTEFIAGRANQATYMKFDSAGNWLDYLGGVNATLTSGVATFGPSIDGSGNKSAHVGGLARWGQSGSTTLGAGVNVTMSVFLQVDVGFAYVDQQIFSFAPSGLALTILSSGNFEVGGGTGPNFTFPDFGIIDGTPHMVTLVSTVAANTVRLYVDGVYRSTVTGSLEGIQWGGSDFFGEVIGTPADARAIYLQQLTIFSEAFTDAQVLQHYRATQGQVIESTSARCARILDNVSWPAAWRTLPPSSGLGAARGECADTQRSGFALNALRDVEASEQGRLFAGKSNFLTLQARYDAFETTRGKTVQATFSDDGAGIGYESFAWNYDDRDVLNDVTINWSDGSQRSTDSTSIAAVGHQSKTINTVLSTQAQATDMAAGVVAFNKDAAMRTRAIRVQPANGAHWATVLGLEIGDRIQVEATPMNVGSQLVQTLSLEAISWRITGDQWVVELFGTPIPTGVFVLDESLLDTGRLGF